MSVLVHCHLLGYSTKPITVDGEKIMLRIIAETPQPPEINELFIDMERYVDTMIPVLETDFLFQNAIVSWSLNVA